MDGQDDARAGRDRGLHALRLEVPAARVGLDGHDGGADRRDREPGRDVRVAGDDDLVARTHTHGRQREREGVEAIGHTDAVARAHVLRVGPLEGLDLGATDVPAGAAHAQQRLTERIGELVPGGADVQEGNVHEELLTASSQMAWSRW